MRNVGQTELLFFLPSVSRRGRGGEGREGREGSGGGGEGEGKFVRLFGN